MPPPDRLGRYRILDPIEGRDAGASWEGWDDQLQRKVRITYLAVEGGRPHDSILQRARVVSSLSHPAFSHTYEVFPDDGGVWVVSEYLNDRPLLEVIASMPLTVDEIAKIGEDIAQAVNEAHRSSCTIGAITAADLVRSETGHVKIRPASLIAGCTTPVEDSESGGECAPQRTGVPPPEPIFGVVVIARLLEELIAASEPFPESSRRGLLELRGIIDRCASTGSDSQTGFAEIIAALRSVRRTTASVTSNRPSVRRGRRSARLHSAFLAAVAVLVGTVMIWSSRKPVRQTFNLAVMPIQDATHGSHGALAAAIAEALTSALAGCVDGRIATPRDVARAIQDGAVRMHEIGLVLGVDDLIEASVTETSATGPMRIVLSRASARDGHLLWSSQIETDAASLAGVQAVVKTEIVAGLARKEAAQPTSRYLLPDSTLSAYLEAWDAISGAQTQADLRVVYERLDAELALEPAFEDAVVLLVDVDVESFTTTHDPALLRRASDLLERLRATVGDDPRLDLRRVILARLAGDSSNAAILARALTRRAPRDPAAWVELGRALASQNQWSEAEYAFERSYMLSPAFSTLDCIVSSRIAVGDLAGAQASLEPVRLAGPERPFWLLRRARLEEAAGDLQSAAATLETLARKRGLAEDLARAGTVLLATGRPVAAASYLAKAVAAAPQDPALAADLALALDRAGRSSEANATFSTCVELATRRLRDRGPDAEALRSRAVCLAFTGHPDDADADVRAAFHLDPRDPRILFSGALVDAVAGDIGGCNAWTRRALAAHAPPAWFSAPEFAPMLVVPGFSALFEPSS